MKKLIMALAPAIALAVLSCDLPTISKEDLFTVTGTTAFTKIKVVDITPDNYYPDAEVKFNRVAMNDGVALDTPISVSVVREAYTKAKLQKITWSYEVQGDTLLLQYSVPRTSATDADRIIITFDTVSQKDIIIDMQNGNASILYDDNDNTAMDAYNLSAAVDNGNIDITFRGRANVGGNLNMGNGNITLNLDKGPSANILSYIVIAQLHGTVTIDGEATTDDSILVGTGIPTTLLLLGMVNGNIVLNSVY